MQFSGHSGKNRSFYLRCLPPNNPGCSSGRSAQNKTLKGVLGVGWNVEMQFDCLWDWIHPDRNEGSEAALWLEVWLRAAWEWREGRWPQRAGGVQAAQTQQYVTESKEVGVSQPFPPPRICLTFILQRESFCLSVCVSAPAWSQTSAKLPCSKTGGSSSLRTLAPVPARRWKNIRLLWFLHVFAWFFCLYKKAV